MAPSSPPLFHRISPTIAPSTPQLDYATALVCAPSPGAGIPAADPASCFSHLCYHRMRRLSTRHFVLFSHRAAGQDTRLAKPKIATDRRPGARPRRGDSLWRGAARLVGAAALFAPPRRAGPIPPNSIPLPTAVGAMGEARPSMPDCDQLSSEVPYVRLLVA